MVRFLGPGSQHRCWDCRRCLMSSEHDAGYTSRISRWHPWIPSTAHAARLLSHLLAIDCAPPTKNARSRILAVLPPNMLRLSEKIDCEHKVNMNLVKGWTPSIQACLHFSPRQEARASTGDWPLTRRRSIHLRREACFSLKPQAPSSAPPTGASSLLQGCPKTIRPSLR